MNKTARSSSTTVWHTPPASKCTPALRATPCRVEAIAQKRSASERSILVLCPSSRPSVDSTTA
ncbi:Uncharacterised protein [Mycobacteroides abscessus subsp. abscessus]|nr:Uncharacterised protein [Mycobacteroides abscessus subsp. abscessus]